MSKLKFTVLPKLTTHPTTEVPTALLGTQNFLNTRNFVDFFGSNLKKSIKNKYFKIEFELGQKFNKKAGNNSF